MDETKSILKDVRASVGLTEDTTDFDSELIMYINTALITLNQNGVGRLVTIVDDTTTWSEFKEPTQILGNANFSLVPSFVMLSTKVIFDPPPPSAVDHFNRMVDSILWRLKVGYEADLVVMTTTQSLV